MLRQFGVVDTCVPCLRWRCHCHAHSEWVHALSSVDPVWLSGLRAWDLGEGLIVGSLVLLLEDPGPALVMQGSNLLLALGFRHCTSSANRV